MPRTQPYPPIKKPDFSGYLQRGAHEVYFEICGNGYPIIFLHGGPGAGCSPWHRRLFDPKKWRVILFDQRGSGRSRPFGCIKQNTTQDLVGDIKALLDFLKIKKAVLFGGSWGSTLALIYAVNHPETVSAMILRGIWLGEKSELNYYTRGGVKMNFPEAWERFTYQVPAKYRNNPLPYYYKKLTAGAKERQHYAYEWARYEESALHLKELSEKKLDKETKDGSFVSLAIMEAHYCLHHLFIEDGYILKRVKKIKEIPAVIIQGRYDMVCPPDAAWRLHKQLSNSNLRMVLAGHSASEPEIQRALIQETNLIYDQVAKL